MAAIDPTSVLEAPGLLLQRCCSANRQVFKPKPTDSRHSWSHLNLALTPQCGQRYEGHRLFGPRIAGYGEWRRQETCIKLRSSRRDIKSSTDCAWSIGAPGKIQLSTYALRSYGVNSPCRKAYSRARSMASSMQPEKKSLRFSYATAKDTCGLETRPSSISVIGPKSLTTSDSCYHQPKIPRPRFFLQVRRQGNSNPLKSIDRKRAARSALSVEERTKT